MSKTSPVSSSTPPEFEGDGDVLKRIGLVAAATIGLSLVATPAFASPATADHASLPVVSAEPRDGDFDFEDAFWTFIDGGEALGYGAAALVASAYAGIALTPALVAQSFGG
jgi:hypothetical protein